MRLTSALFAILLLLSTGSARAIACKVHHGDHVVLYGTTDDPDVLVWDSRFRLQAYESGSFDEMHALLPHARLLPPGTRAIVDTCFAEFVQSKYGGPADDAVGVVIVSGPDRGDRGWIIGSSVRVSVESSAPERKNAWTARGVDALHRDAVRALDDLRR